MQCLKIKDHDNRACKPQSLKYVQCRMDQFVCLFSCTSNSGLMEKDDLSKLGFSEIDMKNVKLSECDLSLRV